MATLPGELSKFIALWSQGDYNVVNRIELGNENICARSCFKKYAVLLVVDNLFVFLQLIMINREEKPLRHVAMVAKFLDNHKPKTSLELTISSCVSVRMSRY